MPTHDELKARAAAAYNAASDAYDAPENTFWDRFGRRTIERLALRPGDRVLDVCSGSGASAIPAALAVRPTGQVIAIDLAEHLLARLRTRAAGLGLGHLEARNGDLLDPPIAGAAAFDAVVCVFGIFFVADMADAVRRLWSRVAPGGRLAITTWGPRLFEPANGAFWDAVRAVRPDLYKGFSPWDSITSPASVSALFAAAGVPDAEVVAEAGAHPLATPEAAWALIMGSGYRGTVEQLSAEDRTSVQARYLADLRDLRVTQVEANVVYATARR